ncbi:MAG: helix-turn-helix domain-containing protein [Atopobiaceae bacterium]|nr:helix-turn-helix domain-containing protein [Atopobiaceae bacterium]
MFELFEGVPDMTTRTTCAEVLGVTVRTVDRLIKAGGIHAVRIGRSVRIPKTEILRIVESGGVNA